MPPAAGDDAARVGGKRLRGVPEEEMPQAAAAAAAKTTGETTIKELEARVARLEAGRQRGLVWWKECGDYVNGHSKELEELQEEALSYNDNLQLVSSNALAKIVELEKKSTEYTNALGNDCVESLKVVEKSIPQIVR